MFSTAIFALLAVGQVSAGAVNRHNRFAKRTTESAILYAYGDDISGYAVFAGSDNLAYIVSDGAFTNMTALTWTIDTTGAEAWTVSANTTFAPNSTTSANATALTAGSTFYAVTTDGSYEQTGFVASASDAPSGAVTTGFVTYGPYAMLLQTDETSGQEQYVSEFWAKNSSIAGVWSLMWNQDGTTQTDSVSITLRTTAMITTE